MRANPFNNSPPRHDPAYAIAICLLCSPLTGYGQLITSVTDVNGEAPILDATVASQRENDMGGVIVPFGEHVFIFTDRTHQYVSPRFGWLTGALSTTGEVVPGIPPYLLGAEYVSTRNDNKDNGGFQLLVGVSQDVTAYLLIDNRAGPSGGDQDSATPPVLGNGILDWVANDGWVQVNTGFSPDGPNGPQPDFVGIDEGTNITTGGFTTRTNPDGLGDLQNFFTVYQKEFSTGSTIVLGDYGSYYGGNMYGLVVAPRPAPPVCRLTVSPLASSPAVSAGAGNPAGTVVTIKGYGNTGTAYTAAELDANQMPANVAWMSLSKTQGPVLAAGATDTLTINYDTNGLAQGAYTAYVRFTDNCNPARAYLHQVNLLILNPVQIIATVSVASSDAPISGGVQAQRENDLGGVIVPFGEDVFCYTDRTHEYNGAAYASATGLLNTGGDVIVGLPSYLLGGEYVSTLNSNRDNGSFRLNVGLNPNLDRGVWAYLLVDNRLNATTTAKTNTTPPDLGSGGTGRMPWVADEGWTQVKSGLFPNGQADFVGIDEGATPGSFAARTHLTTAGPGVGLNNFFTVYRKAFNQGDEIQLKEQNGGGFNMYGLVVVKKIPCQLSVPASISVTGLQDGANPPNAIVSIINAGDDGIPTSYTVAELDANQNGADVPWLSVDKTASDPIAAGASDSLTLSFNTAGMLRGDYTAYLRIVDSCTPSQARLINVTLIVQPPDLRIPQRLAPNGFYIQRLSSRTWDEARVHYNTTYKDNLPVFHGVTGDWKKVADLYTNAVVASIGDVWLPGTDADVVSTLDGTDLGALLGTSEGNFKWLDGTAVPGDLWGSGEPNNDAANQTGSNPGEDAMNLRGDGRYNDTKGGPSMGQPLNNLAYFLLYEGVDLSAQEKIKAVCRRPASGELADLQAAISLMSLPTGDAGIGFEAEGRFFSVSFGDPGADSGGDGNRGGWLDWPKAPFPADAVDTNEDDFATRVTGFIVIPEAGTYTFVLVHDDNARLTIGDQVLTTPAGTGAHTLVATFAAPGDVAFEIIHQERSGDAYLQLFATKGNDTDSAARGFHQAYFLAGDVLGGGLALKAPIDPCGIVFADRDADGDVDQDDFGQFQACYSGPDALLSPGCECFDRDEAETAGFNHVDIQDWLAFQACVTGPAIPWSKSLKPDCVPARP